MKRSTVIVGAAIAPIIVLFVSIGVAYGTPGSGAVGVYPARGSVGSATEPIVLGTPKAVTVTRTVRVKTKQGTVRARVKVQVPGMQPYISCGATACDIVFQVLTIQPGGFTGWHTHPGPTLVAVAAGEGSTGLGLGYRASTFSDLRLPAPMRSRPGAFDRAAWHAANLLSWHGGSSRRIAATINS